MGEAKTSIEIMLPVNKDEDDGTIKIYRSGGDGKWHVNNKN